MFRRRTTTHRWASWAFGLALLLKAAVPMLASAAADVQGKTLVEVCTVYGVKTVAVDASLAADPETGGEHPPADTVAVHGAEHCALGALLLAGAADAPPAGRFAVEPRSVRPAPAHRQPRAPDACAAWAALLKHGPPSFA